jgi:outer membrane receptor for Fe3+-dicitrate
MKRYNINPTVMELLKTDTGDRTEEEVPITAFGTRAGAIYGYDYWGNDVSSGFLAPREPLFLSAYLQDKIEFKDLIINVGLRYDYFDSDDRDLIDPTNPDVDANNAQIEESAWKSKDAFSQLSPRLGISFPVSDRSVFYAQYGLFVQMPELNNVYYDNVRFSRQIVTGSNYYINPIGYAMDPMRTTQYEIGFRQQLGESAAMDITGFYKNVKGLPQVVRVVPTAGADIPTYYKIGNGDFATTKGLEFKFTLRRVARWQASLNYTLTAAEGTGSDETAYYSAVYRGSQIPTSTSPLAFENAHRGAVILDYRFGIGDGGPVFQRSGINFILNFNSGHPYTYSYAAVGGQADAYAAGVDYLNDTRSRSALESQGASTTPWNFMLDMRLDKSFTIYEQLLGTVYVRVTNLLNTKNVVNVYPSTGSAVDDGYISDPNRYMANVESYGPEYLDLYRALNSVNGSSYLSSLGNEIYSNPRVIWLGFKLTY